MIRSKSAGVTGGRDTAGAGPGRDLLQMPLGAAVSSDGTADGTAVGTAGGTADGTADVAVVPDEGSGGWGIVALGLRNSPSLGWPAGGVASAKSDRA